MLQKITAGEPLIAGMNILQERLSMSFQEQNTVWNPGEMYWEAPNYLSVKGWKFKGVSQNGWGWKEALEDILSNAPSQAGPPRTGSQNHVQIAFEYLQVYRVHNLPG